MTSESIINVYKENKGAFRMKYLNMELLMTLVENFEVSIVIYLGTCLVV